MRILDARVSSHSYMPKFELLVDRIPRLDELVFSTKDVRDCYGRHGTIYYAEHDGYVSFLYHDPNRETGFYGYVFTLNVRNDGGTIETRKIKGPWSSRSSVINREGFGPCVEVLMTDDPEAFARGHTFRAGAVTIDLAQQAAEMCGVTLRRRVDDAGEIWYEIVRQEEETREERG